MKKIVILGVSLCISFVVMLSCKKNNDTIVQQDSFVQENKLNILRNDLNNFSVSFISSNITLEYDATQSKSVTESTLKIYDTNKRTEAIIEVLFSVDTNEPAYKLIQHEKVINKAKSLSKEFGSLDIDRILQIYETLGKAIIDNSSIDKSTQLVASMFFQNAILNTINRNKKSQKDCECTPYPVYFVGKSNFWCQEDFFISPSLMIAKIKKENYVLSDDERKVYDYLELNKHLPLISVDILNNIRLKKEIFSQQVTQYHFNFVNKINNKLPSGGGCSDCFSGICGDQLGCCGNYSGCCWLATLDCLQHDVACINCARWHCGPFCKPGI